MIRLYQHRQRTATNIMDSNKWTATCEQDSPVVAHRHGAQEIASGGSVLGVEKHATSAVGTPHNCWLGRRMDCVEHTRRQRNKKESRPLATR